VQTPRSLTREHKARFLAHYRQRGNVTTAAEAVGIDRATVYKWQQGDSRFAAAMAAAEGEATERLEAEAWRRAVDGVERERPIFSRGKRVGRETIREYSDTLLVLLLKARKPETYRERVDLRGQLAHTGPDGGPVELSVTELRERLTGRISELAPGSRARLGAGQADPDAGGRGAA
jgi:hypothetical protein